MRNRRKDFVLRFLHLNNYLPGQLHTQWVSSGRRIVPEVEHAIDVAWQAALVKPGVRIFDGPVCRFEGMKVDNGHLTIELSRCSYRIMLGTNFAHPDFADQYGVEVMGNPVGVSCGLITADNQIIMGRRNASVAYYPHRIHPFAGSLEVRDEVHLFANVRRELHEELSLKEADVSDIICHGVAEDSALRHPETIYSARTRLSAEEALNQLDADEHDGAWHTAFEPESITQALQQERDLTPIAKAVLLMSGRHAFGEAWFAKSSNSILQ